MDAMIQRTFLSPIFILGIMQRSGTNYLRNMLCLHPDTAPRPEIPEDFLVAQAHHLRDYRDGIFRSWSPRWKAFPPSKELGDQMLRHIGEGLMCWLADPVPGKRVVTKTPSVDNIDLIPRLLPDAHFLILVRDGRSVVESGVRSFDWRYPVAMQKWAEAAKRVLDFDERQRHGALRYQVVRYEDVVNPAPEFIARLISFVGLDPARFDLNAAKEMPVRGSSDIRVGGQRRVHWKPVDRTAEFDSVSRFAEWDGHRHAQFAAIAGKAQLALGYELAPASHAPLRIRVRNRCYDARPPVNRWRARLLELVKEKR